MAKGIRVNQLAKELNVPSKSILDKLRDEGLADKAPNHMSVLPLGLAESVREWFHSGDGGVATAVETAAPVAEVSTKPKTSRRKKKAEEATEEVAVPAAEGETAAEEPVAAPAVVEEAKEAAKPHHRAKSKKEAHVETEQPTAPVAEVPVEAEPAKVEPVVKAAPVVPAPAPVQETPAVTVVPEISAAVAPVAEVPVVVSPTEPEKPTTLETPAVAAEVPAVTPTDGKTTTAAAGAHGGAHGHGHGHGRPTVTLANRTAAPVKKPIVPAPQLVVRTPAKIQGPRVVRVEKEETVDVRGPRGPRMNRQQSDTNATTVTPAGPRGGRGVKVSEEDEDTAEKKKKSRTLSSRRRGPDGRRGEAMEKLKEYTEADLIERRDRLNAAAGYRTSVDSHLKKKVEKPQHGPSKTIVQKGEPVRIEEPVTVKALSTALGIKSNEIIAKLMKQGVFANLNQSLDADMAGMIALEYGIELQVVQQTTMDEKLQAEFANRKRDPEKLVLRPPVVTILGHVDHGKTSLLDKIRNANVAAGEAGGITQHTAAWQVQLGDKRVTFIDTPGHQAFTAMRARGANMTDVVVLVVSAAEGVQPQTVESINHAKAAGVPIVVALNKIDRPDSNPDMVLGQLAKEGLNPVEWGGDTEVVRTSAVTGQGIPELIEILHYQADLLELKADMTAPARGMVIESRKEEGLGAVATVLVQDGTLKVGDVILAGTSFGRVRMLLNDRNKSIQEATPATPVVVSGMNDLPNAGDKFYTLENMDQARTIAEERQNQQRQQQLASKSQVTLDSIMASIKATDVKEIRLIVKADVQGSVETLTKTVTEANTDEVKVRVIHAAVGAITESDVELASASGAVIIGFHVVPDDAARQMAEQRRVEVRLYRVIYEILDDLRKALSGLLEPEIREKMHGHVEVRQVFKVSRVGNIAGCMVIDGHIQRGSKIRLIRNGVVITEDLSLESLRRGKEDVREAKQGFECGIKLAGYDDIKIGDVFEAYVREKFQRTL